MLSTGMRASLARYAMVLWLGALAGVVGSRACATRTPAGETSQREAAAVAERRAPESAPVVVYLTSAETPKPAPALVPTEATAPPEAPAPPTQSPESQMTCPVPVPIVVVVPQESAAPAPVPTAPDLVATALQSQLPIAPPPPPPVATTTPAGVSTSPPAGVPTDEVPSQPYYP